jgi:dihydrolipoamide dehydrogenase
VLKRTEDLVGPRNIAGRARLDGPNRLIAGDRAIQANQIVLAPGSSPIMPKFWRVLGDRVLTSDTIFDQMDLPQRIGVIGLGPVGVELAQALARLGIEVHAFDSGKQFAGPLRP